MNAADAVAGCAAFMVVGSGSVLVGKVEPEVAGGGTPVEIPVGAPAPTGGNWRSDSE